MEPSVKHGDRDSIPAAYLFHRTTAGKIRTQDDKQEAEGIGPVWDDTGGENRMGMPAGIADEPGYRKNASYLAVSIPFHQISVIASERT